MIVVYTQDATYIRSDAEAAKDILFSVYGAALGNEAYIKIKNAREGTIYRKHGGPRVEVVSEETAKKIKEKENSLGTYQN